MRQPNAKNCSSVSHVGEQQEDAAGEEEADRRAELREHAVPGALAGRRVLDRQQHRAAPLAAEAEALAEAAEREQQRRRDADGAVGRQQRQSRPSRCPIVSSAATSVVLRPMRSPKWPKSAEPIGRARNAIANVASEASVAEAGSDAGKEQPGEDEHRGGRVDVEVEELDRRADQAGEQHLARPVHRLVNHRALCRHVPLTLLLRQRIGTQLEVHHLARRSLAAFGWNGVRVA